MAAARVVEKRRGHRDVSKHGRPFSAGDVGGDDDRGFLSGAADKAEQQLPIGQREGQIAQIIEEA